MYPEHSSTQICLPLFNVASGVPTKRLHVFDCHCHFSIQYIFILIFGERITLDIFCWRKFWWKRSVNIFFTKIVLDMILSQPILVTWNNKNRSNLFDAFFIVANYIVNVVLRWGKPSQQWSWYMKSVKMPWLKTCLFESSMGHDFMDTHVFLCHPGWCHEQPYQ